MRRTWRGRATRSCAQAARQRPMSSRASCWRCSGSYRGRTCRPCRSRSCCCRAGFPFHLSQDVLLGAHRARAASGAGGVASRARAIRAGVGIEELFARPPEPVARGQGAASDIAAGRVLQRARHACCSAVEPLWPKTLRRRAIDQAVAFVTERLNGEDGLGAIYPAMANCGDDVRRARLSAGASRSRHRAPARSTSCWSSGTTRPIASPASRRSGIRRLPPTR